MRCLIVEDDPRIAGDLKRALTGAGFLTDHVADGNLAWERGSTENFDLIVLDLGLPGLDGITILKRWREEGCELPVLVLTARGAWTERVEGIEAGADDYLPKPFRMEELIARARALTRRIGRTQARQVLGRLSIDLNRMNVALDGVPVSLTPLEFRLIAYLAHNQERVVAPVELLEHLYGDDNSREVNAVEAVIVRIRRKLGSGVISTRRGFGYRLEGVS